MICLTLLSAVFVADAWEVQAIPVPEGEVVEVGGIAFPDAETVAVSTRRGRVWLIDGALDDDPSNAQWVMHADGLYEGMGLDVDGDDLVVLQRGELSRLRDVDGDRIADAVDVMADDWGLSPNYHEFAFGLPRDEEGHRFISLNLGFMSPDWWYGQSVEPYRGWILRVSPDGEVVPWAHGFRSPCGLGFDAQGRLLATDNQGDWMPSSPIFVVQQGGFHGHPSSLRWTSEYLESERLPHHLEPVAEERVPAAIWIPYDWSRSTGNVVTDATGGRFGPFDGQLFVAELTTGRVLRADLEEIDGVSQGAVWPFVDRVGSVARIAFAEDGSLLCGLTNRGWGGLAPGHGVKRIVWNGQTPLEMKHVRLHQTGFDIEFTHPLSERPTPEQIEVDTYDYNWWWKYGSPEQRRQTLDVQETALSEDGRILRVDIPNLTSGRVARLHLHDVHDREGRPLRTEEVAYTINRMPGGPTRHVARRVSAPPLEEVLEDESGWTRLTWGEPTQLWEGDWRLAKDKLDPNDPTRFTSETGAEALVNDQATAPYVFASPVPGDGEVKLPVMLAQNGSIRIGLPGGDWLVLSDHDGSGSVRVMNSAGETLVKADQDVWRGPGQWHWVYLRVEGHQLQQVMIDDQQILGGVELSHGGDTQWLRFERGVGASAIADVRIRPWYDMERSGRSLLEKSTAVLTGRLGGAMGSEGWRFDGQGVTKLQEAAPRNFKLSAIARFREDTSASIRIGDVRVEIAEGRDGAPSTGSIHGAEPLDVHLIPAGAWYQLEVEGTDTSVQVKLNGLVVCEASRIPATGPIAMSLDGGWIDIEALSIQSMD